MGNLTATLKYEIIEEDNGCSLSVCGQFMNERYNTLLRNCATKEILIEKVRNIIRSDCDSEMLMCIIDD